MNIDFANLQLQYQKYKVDIDASIQSVLNKSNYIMGDEVNELEEALKEFTLAEHVIACSSGTDALLMAMMALDIEPGDEIITTPFTFVATAETITLMKAKPVFVDIEYDTFNIDASKIESAITSKTKAIMPVSLYGQPADMKAIQLIAQKHNIKIIIDGAQSFGATFNDKKDSCLGDISTTSFFPAKPLGCYGDGGAVFTNNSDYANKIRMIRVHGQTKRYSHKIIGIGGRLDTIQAAVLLVKLSHYKDEINQRNDVAEAYFKSLEGLIKKPMIKSNRTSVWAQYTLRFNERDLIQSYLKKIGIPTAIHYPLPLHLQECFSYLEGKKGDFPVSELAANEVLSLPMNPFLTKNEIKYISENVNKVFNEIAL